jgi:hypothetical protein
MPARCTSHGISYWTPRASTTSTRSAGVSACAGQGQAGQATPLMSTYVACRQQLRWDGLHRGVAHVDKVAAIRKQPIRAFGWHCHAGRFGSCGWLYLGASRAVTDAAPSAGLRKSGRRFTASARTHRRAAQSAAVSQKVHGVRQCYNNVCTDAQPQVVLVAGRYTHCCRCRYTCL